MSQHTESPNMCSPPETHIRGNWLLLARVGWVAIALLTVVIFIISLPFSFAQLHTVCVGSACPEPSLRPDDARALSALGLSVEFFAEYFLIVGIIFALVWFAIGALIFWRASDDHMALLSALMLVTFGGTFVSDQRQLANTYPAWQLPVATDGLISIVCFGLFLYIFPAGRFAPRWTRWPALIWLVNAVAGTVFPNTPFNSNNWPAPFGAIFFIALVFCGFAAQIYRYRRISTPMHRQQTKWVVFGLIAALIGFLALSTSRDFVVNRISVLLLIVVNTVVFIFWLLIPLSFGIAILRYRLYDIDIIIRRTLIYSTLTLSLGLIYLGCIILSRTLVAPFTGSSELAIVVSTLAIAALFFPLRRRIQNLIDRRFYRRKYDAAKVLAAFGATARDETDLTQLTDALVHVVDTTVQPEFVGVWLNDSKSQAGGKKLV